MYVCICKAVTEKNIDDAHANGATRLRDLVKCLDLGRQCGKCVRQARDQLQRKNEEHAGGKSDTDRS